MTLDPHLVVRAGAVYVAAVATILVLLLRRTRERQRAGAWLALCWNLPALLGLQVAAARYGWWTFDASGGLLLGMPVDLYLTWAWLWALPSMAFPSSPLVGVTGIAVVVDVAVMPLLSPTVRLGPHWLIGEAAGVLLALAPSQLLARWTANGEHLPQRAFLQVFAFTGLMAFVLPAMAIDGATTAWSNPLHWSRWHLGLMAQLLAIPAALGLSAVQEFVTRGGGTPVPFDPPKRLVTSGLYAYVGNPMQIAGVVVLLLLGFALQNVWIAVAGVMAHIYSIGIAGWDEDADLRARFGEAWLTYRRAVRRWWPRWRPWVRADCRPATLFVSESCGMCSEVGAWFLTRGAAGLQIAPAENHPSLSLTRITYESADGTERVRGIEAVGRALEHVHFGWALIGAVMRLPIARQGIQLVVDASGGEPRSIHQDPSPEAATRALDQAH